MNHIISKEQAKEIMSLTGETRGFNIKLDSEYILKTKGEEGLKKLEQEMEKLGYSIKYREKDQKEINILCKSATELLTLVFERPDLLKPTIRWFEEKIKRLKNRDKIIEFMETQIS